MTSVIGYQRRRPRNSHLLPRSTGSPKAGCVRVASRRLKPRRWNRPVQSGDVPSKGSGAEASWDFTAKAHNPAHRPAPRGAGLATEAFMFGKTLCSGLAAVAAILLLAGSGEIA